MDLRLLLRWLSSKESACNAADERIKSPDQEDALEKEKASPFQYSCLGNSTEEPGGLQSMGSQKSLT